MIEDCYVISLHTFHFVYNHPNPNPNPNPYPNPNPNPNPNPYSYAYSYNNPLLFHPHLPHNHLAVDDSLNNMIKKLQERGDVSEGRIQSIEASLKRDVQSSITKSMEKRVTDLEKAFDKNVKAAVSKSTKQWVVPFVIVVGVVGLVVLVLYSKYTSTQKSNLL